MVTVIIIVIVIVLVIVTVIITLPVIHIVKIRFSAPGESSSDAFMRRRIACYVMK